MKTADQDIFLAGQDYFALIGRKHFNTGPGTIYLGCPDEHSVERLRPDYWYFYIDFAAFYLPAVGVSFYVNFDEVKQFLLSALLPGGKQDQAGAGAH